MSKRRTWEAHNTRVKVENSDDSTDFIELPIDTLEVRPQPYVPEGGTVMDLYDDRRKYRDPTFGYKIILEYDHERTGADFHGGLGNIRDILRMKSNGKTLDFFVRYDDTTDSYVTGYTYRGTTHSNGFKCLDMIPDVTEETANIMFEKKARQKPRSLELVSGSRSYTHNQIAWILE